MPALRKTAAWKALEKHFQETKNNHMRDAFTSDPDRFNKFSIRYNDLLFDYSKNRINAETIKLLIDLVKQAGLAEKTEAMFTGEKINSTEDRAVLHTALRNRGNKPIYVDGKDVMPDINRVLAKMRSFCNKIHSGDWRGYSGKPIKDIVNIGIGGSDLGPKMVCTALTPSASMGLNAHFISNVDQTDIVQILSTLSPETTLFIVASKSFTTQETMINANSARKWLLAKAQDKSAIAKHFVAISTESDLVTKFGIAPDNMFEFWDWVGGRYSLWSAVGLSIALYAGMDQFEDLLTGAYEADKHFRNTPYDQNIPVIMAVLGIWYNNFFQADSNPILPYNQSMLYFADYFQQGDMESNGKSINNNGERVDYETGPIIWGQPGTNGQHAFYQMMHQGTKLVPCDFFAPAISRYNMENHHNILLSNFLAQPEALMRGLTAEEVINELPPEDRDDKKLIAAKTFDGNKPSNSFLFKMLTAQTLGALIAFYEHKIFVQGVVWNINSYDQMGVELGKKLAKVILPELLNENIITSHDSSTNGLINYFKELR